MKTGLGAESIIYSSTAQGSDTIYRFEAGTADDVVYIASTAFDLVDGAGEVIALAGGNGIANATAAVFSNISGTAAASTGHGAGESIIVVTYANFASAGAVLVDIGSGGQAEVTLASAQNDANILIIWSDGTDSFLTLYSGSADIGGANANLDDDATSYETVATFAGVTVGALAVSNFKFYGIAEV